MTKFNLNKTKQHKIFKFTKYNRLSYEIVRNYKA